MGRMRIIGVLAASLAAAAPNGAWAGNDVAQAQLIMAAQNCNLAGVEAALGSGAKVDAQFDNGGTALWNAATMAPEAPCLDVVTYLLERQHAKLDLKDKENGQTPLVGAVNMGNRKIALYLIDRGADANASGTFSGSGRTPVLVLSARVDENLDVTRELLKYGADREAANALGQTALAQAAASGSLATVKYLKDEAKSNTKMVDNSGKNPEALACTDATYGNLQLFKNDQKACAAAIIGALSGTN